MTTIAAEQFERTAIVYVRQSTAFQVSNNLESGRRQCQSALNSFQVTASKSFDLVSPILSVSYAV
jgi:hypothetical protein